MRKFGIDRNGVSIGTTAAMAQSKRSCLVAGLQFLTDQRVGAAIGHLCEVIDELSAEVAALRQEVAAAKSVPAPKQVLVDVTLPEHLQTPYRQMNGEQRKQFKEWKAQHAA